jgi:predicted small secreted protein
MDGCGIWSLGDGTYRPGAMFGWACSRLSAGNYRRRSQKRNLLSTTMPLTALALGACSTAGGFGQDVEDTGEYVQDKAEDASE